jgi:hypothetical protein
VEGVEIPVVFPAKDVGAKVDREVRVARSPVRLRFMRYYPNARWTTTVVEGQRDNPGVHLRWSRNGAGDRAWLLPLDPERAVLDSPLRIESVAAASAFAADSVLAAVQAERPRGRGELRVRVADRPAAEIPLDGPVPRRVQDGPYRIHLLQWFSHLVLREGKPMNATTAMTNPAVLFEVEGPKGTENHIVFAYHEMGSLLPGGGDYGYEVDADYIYDGQGRHVPRVVLVRSPDKSWRIAANFDLDTVEGAPLEIGHTYTSATTSLELVAEEISERAELRDELVNLDRQERNPAVFVQVEGPTGRCEPQWVTYGDQDTLQAGDRDVRVEFGRRQFPLGFSVHLVDFLETTYPGTSRSATYSSDVLVASGGGDNVPIHISMNKPLKHRGFRLFQSSFVREGSQEASIFSVSYDPGVTVVYTGFIIFIVGMVAIFYLKPIIKKAYLRSAIGERTGS